MTTRLALAALAAAAVVPFTATPATAHGTCYFDAKSIYVSGGDLWGSNYLYCDTYHSSYEITTCLEWGPLPSPSGVPAPPYVTMDCESYTYTAAAIPPAPHYIGGGARTTCVPGHWRMHMTGVAEGTVHADEYSNVRLIAAECAV